MAWRRFQREPDAANGGAHFEDDPRRGGVATRAPEAPPPAAQPVTHDRDHRVEGRHEARERFGGVNWGAAFFGWLTALGMAAILTALLSAAGAAIGLTEGSAATDAVGGSEETVSIVGGALLIAVLAIAYFCGGYVAGRMSRFDGGRQGFAVWALGLLITVAVGAAAAIFGSEWNVLTNLDLPRIPVEEGDLATGAGIALAAALLVTLIGAIAGGAKGRRYHDRVDRAGVRDW